MTIEQEARAEAEMRLDENAWMFRGTRHNAQDLRERGSKMASGDKIRTLFVNQSLTSEEYELIVGKIANWFEDNSDLGFDDFDDMIIEVVGDR